MLELKVEKYCENCMDFEADVNKSKYYIGDVYNSYACDTYIQCKNSGRCKKLYKYLKGEINGKS